MDEIVPVADVEAMIREELSGLAQRRVGQAEVPQLIQKRHAPLSAGIHSNLDRYHKAAPEQGEKEKTQHDPHQAWGSGLVQFRGIP